MTPQSPSGTRASRAIVPLLSLCAFASAASMRICDPLLPLFSVQFDVPLARAAQTTTGFALAYGCCQFLFGPLGDRYGKLLVITVTAALAGLCAVGCALSPTLDWLVGWRVAAGAFAGASIPLSLAWIGDNVAFAERQPVLARYLIGQMLGMSAGQVAGGSLADWVGWRAAFVLIAVAFGLATVMLYRRARLDARAVRARPASGSIVGTFARQSRQLLAERWPRRLITTAALEGFLLFGAMALVASFVQADHGFTPTAAGLSVALFGLGGIVYASNARRLLGRLGGTGLAVAGGALFAVAMVALWLAVPTVALSRPVVFVAPLLAGLGYYMLHNTLQNQASQMTTDARGAGFSWFATGLWVGQGLGVIAAALLVQRAGFAAVFLIAGGGILVLAISFASALRARTLAQAANAAAAPSAPVGRPGD
jgi:predicted MFS family arabinose efflux permease